MVSCQYVAYDLRTVRTDAKVQEANEYFGDMRDFYSGKKNLISLSISKIIAGYQPLKIKTGLALVIPSVAFMTGIFSYLENLTELGAKLLEGIGFGGAVESNPNLGALAWLLAGIAARVAMLRRYWVHRGKVFCTVHVMQDLENIGVDMKIPIGFVLFTRKPE